MLLDDHVLDALLQDTNSQEEERYKLLASFFPYLERGFNRVGVTPLILWGEYRNQHPGGYSYSQFCDHYRDWKTSRSGTLHIEQVPSDKVFIDFTGKKLSVVDPATGELTQVEVYVAVLGYSQLTYVEAVYSQKKQDFIRATENALHFFCGVPKVLVPDNLKSGVDKANKYEALLNAEFLDSANQYGTSVLPARSRKPRHKALVEKAVNIVYSRIFAPLRDQVFSDVRSLNLAIGGLGRRHNQQNFQQCP